MSEEFQINHDSDFSINNSQDSFDQNEKEKDENDNYQMSLKDINQKQNYNNEFIKYIEQLEKKMI